MLYVHVLLEIKELAPCPTVVATAAAASITNPQRAEPLILLCAALGGGLIVMPTCLHSNLWVNAARCSLSQCSVGQSGKKGAWCGRD